MKKILFYVLAFASLVLAISLAAPPAQSEDWNAAQRFLGGSRGPIPASEVIAASGTITISASYCGGVKSIHTNGTAAVTTDTTNTFTAPTTTGLSACCIDIINDGTGSITLDNNANFYSAGGANVALGVGDTIRVCSNGVAWYQVGGTGNN